MRPRPYLRAYMAGIVVPTLFLLVIMTTYAFTIFYLGVSRQFERPLTRAIVLPMAVVPNLWGVWNMLYLATKSRTRLPLGVHGSLLVVVLVPTGVTLARLLDVFTMPWLVALELVPVGMAVYYLVWKFLVGALNHEMGIA